MHMKQSKQFSILQWLMQAISFSAKGIATLLMRYYAIEWRAGPTDLSIYSFDLLVYS